MVSKWVATPIYTINHLLTSWDIQVPQDDMKIHEMFGGRNPEVESTDSFADLENFVGRAKVWKVGIQDTHWSNESAKMIKKLWENETEMISHQKN